MAKNHRKFNLHCYVCKENFVYIKKTKKDALDEFHAFGHYNEKTNITPRTLKVKINGV